MGFAASIAPRVRTSRHSRNSRPRESGDPYSRGPNECEASTGLIALLSAAGLPAWPLLPLTVAVLLPLSLWSRQTPGTWLGRIRRSSRQGG